MWHQTFKHGTMRTINAAISRRVKGILAFYDLGRSLATHLKLQHRFRTVEKRKTTRFLGHFCAYSC